MTNEPVDTASKKEGTRHTIATSQCCTKITDNFHYARSAILEAIYVLLQINISTTGH